MSLALVLSSPARKTSPPPGPDPNVQAGTGLTTPDRRDGPLPELPPYVGRRDGEAPLALTASDGSGLTLAELHGNAVVRGSLAFTELHLVFENPENRQREGTFRIALPTKGNVARFAMKVGDKWQEGEVVEKEKARAAYEDFLHRKQDPALLERGPGNDFSARVFPIPARGRKELIISYAEELTSGAPYVLPMKGLPEVGLVDVTVTEEGQAPRTLRESKYAPSTDLVYEGSRRMRAKALRTGGLAVARVEPAGNVTPDPVTNALVLVDTSASRGLGLENQVSLVEGVLRSLGARRHGALPVTVAAFDQTVEPVYRGDANKLDEGVMATLRRRGAFGASNLETALLWVADEASRNHATRVVIVTDAVPTAGEDDAAKLALVAAKLRGVGVERLDVVVQGGIRNEGVAKALVTAGLAKSGVVIQGDEGVDMVVHRLDSGTRGPQAVAVEGATWFWPKTVDGAQTGDDVLVYAEVPEGTPLRVRVGDEPARAFDTAAVERPLLERAWAQAKVMSLEEEERTSGKDPQLRKRIIELSTSQRVPSAYTSLVVLETDADYARFHIDRHSLRDVLTVRNGHLEPLRRAFTDFPKKDVQPREKTKTRFEEADPRRPLPAAPLTDTMEEGAKGDGLALSGTGAGGGGLGSIGGIGAGSAPGGGRMGASGRAMPSPEPMAAARDEDKKAEAPEERMAAPKASRAEESAESEVAMNRGAPSPMAAAPAAPAPPPATRAPVADQAAPPPVGGPGFGIAAPTSVARRPPPRPQQPEDDGQPRVEPYSGRYKEVKLRLSRKDPTGALELASNWQKAAPGDVLALVALGEAEEATGDRANAARAYGSIIDLFPARADLRRFAGERLEHMGNDSALSLAQDSFDKARRDRPDHPSSHRFAAYARVQRGDYAGAFDVLLAALARRYPEGRFAGVERILREDLGLVAAAWMATDPSKKNDILRRLEDAGGTMEDQPSLRFVLAWETDGNDVDFHIKDGRGGHAFYSAPHLPSGGDLYADVTTGYGPECFTIRGARRAGPYKLQAHYYSRGPMGYGMGTLHVLEHDGKGHLKIEERPFLVMNDHAFVELGTVSGG